MKIINVNQPDIDKRAQPARQGDPEFHQRSIRQGSGTRAFKRPRRLAAGARRACPGLAGEYSGYAEEGDACEEVKMFLGISVGDRVGVVGWWYRRIIMARKVDESDTKEKIEQDDEGEMSFEDWKKCSAHAELAVLDRSL